MFLGGRGAEIVIFEDVTTGAQNDLQRATEIARSMVTLYGMTDSLAPVTYKSPPNPFLPQQPFNPQTEMSEETARLIDTEVRSIIESRMEGVLATLREHEDFLHKVAKQLLTKETIEADEFFALIGKRQIEQPAAMQGYNNP